MKFLILSKSETDPATRYRVRPVSVALREQGDEVVEVAEPSFVMQLRLLLEIRNYDVVFVQRKLFNQFFIRSLHLIAKRIVFDFDDAVFSRSNGEQSKTRENRFRSTLKSASLVLAGNSFLVAAATRYADNVHLIPTCVDTSRYAPVVDKADQLTLVWIGSESTSRYLKSHCDILNAIGRAFPGTRLKVISDFEFKLEDLEVVNVPWSVETEVFELASSHIGIAPMVDDVWTRGKCALKVIQYMAAGLPVVSSNAGANGDVVRHGETGFLATTEQQWLNAIEQLCQVDRRDNMGEAGRQRAIEQYAMDQTTNKVLELISQANIRP